MQVNTFVNVSHIKLGMYRYTYLTIYRCSNIYMVLKPITDVLHPSLSNLKTMFQILNYMHIVMYNHKMKVS